MNKKGGGGESIRSLLLLLKSNHSRHHSRVLYHWEGQEKRKDRQSRKSEEKVMFYLSLPIPRKETGDSHQWWNQGVRPPDAEENPGSRYRQRLEGQARPRLHSRYIHVKQE